MSNEPLNSAMGRIDAAAEDLRARRAASSADFAALAAALDRVESLIAAGTAESPDGNAAVERIADIAFVLHEREVEPSLCDALDAAVREISGTSALSRESVERSQQAAELLRELSRRVGDMMALEAERRAKTAVAEPARAPRDDANDDEAAASDDPGAVDVGEDDEFAKVVAALVASLPSLAQRAAAEDDETNEAAEVDPAATGESKPEPEGIAEPPELTDAAEPLAKAAEQAVAGAFDAESPFAEQPAAETVAAPENSAEAKAVVHPDPTPIEAADNAVVVETEPEAALVEAAVEMTLVIESSTGAFLSEVSMAETLVSESPSAVWSEASSPAEATPAERSETRQIPIEQIPEQQIPDDSPSASVSSAAAEEGSAEAIASETEANERMPSGEVMEEQSPSAEPLSGEAFVSSGATASGGATETASLVESAADETADSAAVELPAPDLREERASMERHSQRKSDPQWTSDNAPPASVEPAIVAIGAEPAPLAAAPSAGDDAVCDDGDPVSIGTPADNDQSSFDLASRDDGHPLPVEVEESRVLLPQTDASLGPEDDPGDLFEPIAEMPGAGTVVVGETPLAGSALQPEDVPLDAEPGTAIEVDAPKSQETPRGSVNAVEISTASGISAAVPRPEPPTPTPLAAIEPVREPSLPPTSAPAARPQPASTPAAAAQLSVAARPAANDPLAQIRALSEEEMIALFS